MFICLRALLTIFRLYFLALTTLPSANASKQTDGFADAFKLAFEDPAQAYSAYDKFIADGTIPAHGRGPWVVFIGRTQGVFVS